jgi:pilus assembly protein CpaB
MVSVWSGLWKNGLKGPQIIVAVQEIEAGSQIKKSDLKSIYWNHAPVPPKSFKDLSELTNRVARQKIVVGEPILEEKLAATGSKAGLAATIATGKRAITVKVNDVAGVPAAALPGSYVDILVSVKQGSTESYTKTVLTNIKVLAVPIDANSTSNKPKTISAVTVELTPEEAEKLDLARTIGTLSLTLKNEVDALIQNADSSQGKSTNIQPKTETKETTTDNEVGGSVQVIRGMKTEVIRGMKKDN